MPIPAVATRAAVAASLRHAPVVGVVRTASRAEAAAQARRLRASGIELIEITFTVPEAPALLRELLAESAGGPPWLGLGTVTDGVRARAAIDAGAQFLVSPSVSAEVATLARAADLFLIVGALTPTEIVEAHRLGADLVKVYPLAPVGGARYLATVRQPLADIPMLAAGGFAVDEIPEYRRAGATAFNVAAPALLALDDVPRALRLARGEREEESA
ncbi:MAG: bifunctional 4-hydroxy-2-oxoglutarate aldolase/2-dehydro-3-deoxy-phosphogluconate aldolase [Acidobacteriota bacterium]